MRKGQSRQISFRIEEEIAARVEAAATVEDLALADFVRKVFRVAFSQYETAGSLHAMRQGAEAGELAKRQVALEKKVAASLQSSAEEKRGGKRKAG